MGEGAPAGGLRLFQSQHSREQGSRLFDVPWACGSDAADVSGEYAADGVVPRLPSEHGKSLADAGPGGRNDVDSAGESSGIGQEVSRGPQYPEQDRAYKLLDVPSLVDGMSDHEQKPWVDSHPPTAEERELREYPLNLTTVRQKLATQQGKKYWRTLDELAADPHFEDMLQREYPRGAAEWDESVDRRDFLKLMGASLALAGMGGCGLPPEQHVVPYVKQPDGLVLGKPLHFATVMPFAGDALGLLVESHEGRPTKIEGNPDHPASLGATDAFAQATILDLYDPDRAKTTTKIGQLSTWEEFKGTASGLAASQKAV